MANAVDHISLTEGKNALGIGASDTSQDTDLAAYITGVSMAIDGVVGPVVVRTITDELHDGGDGLGRGRIFLRYHPVNSVTTVTEYASTTAQVLTAESNSTKPASAYNVDLKAGVISRRGGGGYSRFPVGVDNIKVTYIAGRFADTASVDANFKRAAEITLLHNWRREQGQGTVSFNELQSDDPLTPTFAIPRAALQFLPREGLAPLVG